ncbi:MAG: sulfatase [Minicystis sp.]
MSVSGRRTFLRWPAIRPASAQLAGWVTVALVSLVAVHVAPARELKRATAALRDALVLGHLVAAGLVVWAAVTLWQRLGPKRAGASYAAIAAGALAITAPALAEDLSILAGKIGLPYNVARAILVVIVAAAVPLAAILGRLVARPWLRGIGLLVAVAMAGANHFVLPNDYLGVHLVAAIAAATLFGAALATPDASAGRAGKWVRGGLAILGAWAVFIRPANSVALAVQRVTGDVVAPWLGRLRGGDEGDVDARELGKFVDAAQAEWWKSRLGSPAVPPSSPSLLPKNPIVILVTVDCLRADVLAGNKQAKKLPAMFALRDGGVEFTEARATATATSQSVSSIFTARYYSQLYWKPRPNWNAEAMYPDADPTPRFTELLTPAGVTTVTISGMPGLTREFGVVKGFQEENIVPGKRGFAAASAIMPPVLARLSAQGAGPLFLYVHFTDAHAPYDHGNAKGKPYDQYLSGLAHVDAEIAKLVAKIDQDPALKDRTALFLSADHGEAFGEHGTYNHATTVYEELLRVPLLARLPGAPARKVTKPVTLVDLAPTILDLFGVPTPGEMMGQSLVPFFRGEDPVITRPIVADSSRLQRAIVFPDGMKIIHDRRRDTVELFDLKKDPKELHDLFETSGATGDARLQVLKAFFKTHTLKRPGYKVPYGR